jgi:hypothetical protein
MMDYCNGVQGFINYALSNPRNISGDGIRCSCKRCKNKKRFIDPNAVTIHPLKKKDHREIHMLICTQRTICSLRHHGRIDGWVNF